MKHRLAIVAATLLAAHTGAWATPYWIAWEGDDWPENQGWRRSYGTLNSPGGGQAVRTLTDGLLYIDSMQGLGVYDSLAMDRPGAMDPSNEEVFAAEWRMRIEAAPDGWDPHVGFASDTARVALFVFSVDNMWDISANVIVPIEPSTFHTYRFVSSDMSTYRLFIDDALAIEGDFITGVVPSRVAWGDGLTPSESRATWDYFRFGVVPEIESACQCGIGAIVFVLGRRQR